MDGAYGNVVVGAPAVKSGDAYGAPVAKSGDAYGNAVAGAPAAKGGYGDPVGPPAKAVGNLWSYADLPPVGEPSAKANGYGIDPVGGPSAKAPAPGSTVPYDKPVGPPATAPGSTAPYGKPVPSPAPATGSTVPYGKPVPSPAPAPVVSTVPYGKAVGPPAKSCGYVNPPAKSGGYGPSMGKSEPLVAKSGDYGAPDPAKEEMAISKLKEKLSAADQALAAGDAKGAIDMYTKGLHEAGQAKAEFADSEGVKAVAQEFEKGLDRARSQLTGGASPSRPPASPTADRTQQRALEYFECPVCFDGLHKKPLAVFVSGGKRSCSHSIHAQCAEQCRSQMKCPTCESAFHELRDVPRIADDEHGWFKAVDTDGDGKLDKQEAFAALASSLPGELDNSSAGTLKNTLETKWKEWDPNGDGKVEFHEMMDVGTGLRDFLISELKKEAPIGALYGIPPPDLNPGTKAEWFKYWDKDSSGSLDREEVLRAIVKTFNLSSDVRTIKDIREYLVVVWAIYDENGDNLIDTEEFLRRRIGLGDSLFAALPFFRARS